MTRLKIEIALATILVLSIVSLFVMYKKEHTERIRTEGNQTALLTGIKHYKTKDSLNAVTVQELTLSKSELKQHEAELVETVNKMGIKLKRLESITQVSTETKIVFKPVRKDSLIYIPGKDSIIRLDCMEYKDAWTSFIGCYDGENPMPNVSLIVRDSIEIVGHIVPKEFPVLKFIKYGVKSVNVDVTSYNPSTDIKYAKNIKLKK